MPVNMLQFDCPKCRCQLRYADGTVGMVKCLACDEVFLLPKDARVAPNDPLITLPSCLGVRRHIKLEYLPDGSDACPLVRLYDFDTDGVRCLRDTFRSLAEGTLHVSLRDTR